ncbi:MAG: bifunctional phosphoribosylaminoimidazolecarboxamide formyltransferase/IMP cyclohydrolase [Polyangiaceae bacterium]
MPVRTALVSVSDKTGLIPFARGLAELGVSILSTGGTAKALSGEGIAIEPVESYTGSPEVMAGRVKTLHPRVHGGILMRGDVDNADLQRLGGRPIDLVVVNLYPFEQVTASKDATLEEAIENIDIGGPSMIRSAAKNHARVAVVCDPSDYGLVLKELRELGEVSPITRAKLAAKAFALTASYDGAIAAFLSKRNSDGSVAEFPRYLTLPYERAYTLRYGENPHQNGAFYVEKGASLGTLARAESVGAGGKELSFNNLVDVDAALECVREFAAPAAVVVKHANPCGVAVGATPAEAYKAARDADSTSAFGGIVAFNREVDGPAATLLVETFLECVVAPSFSPSALEALKTKKNLRLLATGAWLPADYEALQMKRVSGGLVIQTRDVTAKTEIAMAKVVTKRPPTEEEERALAFAWHVCKHVKSNAIVFAKGQVTTGVGAGQMSRVQSVQIAVEKAGEKAKGSVMASDAFFPFPDGIHVAAKSGVTAVIQPGGSVKDEEIISAANAQGMAMLFTGARHFRH